MHGTGFRHIYCITPESLCSALRALGCDLNSSCAQWFLTNHYKTLFTEHPPQQPTPQAAAVIGGKTKGGYSIPITRIWKCKTLTVPDHPGNLVEEQETKPGPSHAPPKQPFPRKSVKKLSPLLPGADTGACLCDGDWIGWDPIGGHRALNSRSNKGGQAPLLCSWHNISFQTKTLVTASSTTHEAIENWHCFQSHAHGCSEEEGNSSSFIVG